MYFPLTVQDMCTVGTNGGCHAQATCTTDQSTGVKTCACNANFFFDPSMLLIADGELSVCKLSVCYQH